MQTEVSSFSIKNGVYLRPHGRSENILKKYLYELYTVIN